MASSRRHYRIPYPVAARPRGKWKSFGFQVIDLAEEGIKVEFDKVVKFKVGQVFRADITFHDDETIEVSGKILRREEESLFVIALDKRVPLAKIMSEQRYLINNFPSDFKPFV